jgi:hypothetical protein
MACFTVPLAEAIIVSIVKKNVEKKEKAIVLKESIPADKLEGAIPFSRKLGWLTKMLWGGSFLLAIEHIWHGEVVPWPPFLTAMNNPADIGPMLHEIATVGVTMAVLVTAVWGVMVLVYNRIEHKSKKTVITETAKTMEG